MIDAFENETFLKSLKKEMDACEMALEAVGLAMRRISEALPYYKWIGVYWLKGDTLRLGPYVGAKTEHTRIVVGEGVCGTAVKENANQIVGDVRQRENYLACSLDVRSEIVVLIRDDNGKILGQIDADGHDVEVFDERDETLLTEVAHLIAKTLPQVG